MWQIYRGYRVQDPDVLDELGVMKLSIDMWLKKGRRRSFFFGSIYTDKHNLN